MGKVRNVRQRDKDPIRVPLPFGGETTVPYDGILDTTDEHAALLAEQTENWQPVEKAAKQKSVKAEVIE